MEYIYGVKRGQHFKIGYTMNPTERLEQLQAASTGGVVTPPDMDWTQPLEVLFVVLGDKDTETLCHSLLHATRAEGEWFHWSDQMEALYWPPRIAVDVIVRPRRTMPPKPAWTDYAPVDF